METYLGTSYIILSFVKAYFFFSLYILKATLAQRKDNGRLTKNLNNGNFLGALLDLLSQFNISWNPFLVQSLSRLKIYNKTTRVARLWAVLVGNLAILFFVAFPLCYLFYMCVQSSGLVHLVVNGDHLKWLRWVTSLKSVWWPIDI